MINQSDINIYLIQRKILNVLTAAVKKIAAKTDAKSKSKSKSKLNSESTDSDRNNDNDKIKKKRLIYEIIQTWYQHLEHLNVSNIIWLSEDSQSEIRIKESKFLSFCKACKLAESKKKISCQLMQRFK